MNAVNPKDSSFEIGRLSEKDITGFKREFAFGEEHDLQYRLTPSPSYFWYRKLRMIEDLTKKIWVFYLALQKEKNQKF
ncbi:MAG: hypothetical protein ACFCU8_15475 [Thermosynechococcaceae cyanobacterium]